jgi:CMP-N,N'-diacetyllegionaminic acid synthase
MRVTAIIPARRGSVGVPGKNWRDFCGKPLVRWTVEQALETKAIDEVVVTSDSPEVYDALNAVPVTWIARPGDLSGSEATTESAMLHALTVLHDEPAILVMLQPTSPLRTPDDISACISQVILFGGSVTSVVPAREWRFPVHGRVSRQHRAVFAENGSIYAVEAKAFMATGDRTAKDSHSHLMPDWTRHEIDDEDDWNIVEGLFRQRVLGGLSVHA